MSHSLYVDPTSATPLWQQIEDGLQALIQTGNIPSGTILPSTMKLAKELRVNPSQVSQAYQNLMAKGFLEDRGWQGAVVNELLQASEPKANPYLLRREARIYATLASAVGATASEAIEELKTAAESMEPVPVLPFRSTQPEFVWLPHIRIVHW